MLDIFTTNCWNLLWTTGHILSPTAELSGPGQGPKWNQNQSQTNHWGRPTENISQMAHYEARHFIHWPVQGKCLVPPVVSTKWRQAIKVSHVHGCVSDYYIPAQTYNTTEHGTCSDTCIYKLQSNSFLYLWPYYSLLDAGQWAASLTQKITCYCKI